MKILVCDDELEIRNLLRLLLENSGHTVEEARNGKEALEAVRSDSLIDLCIMDIMMPVMSGIEATAEIRKISDVPILFLTAKSLESDKEAAYSGGGDDYLVKPFSSKELLMKVDALTRRYNKYNAKSEGSSEVIRFANGVVLNADTRTVTRGGVEVELREKEFETLLYLAQNRGRVVSNAEIYESVWQDAALTHLNNTVTVHVLSLRRKLEDNPSSPKLIRTVWGKGYQID